MESDTTAPGEGVVPPVSTPFGNVGLAVCYGMPIFPESVLDICLAQTLLYGQFQTRKLEILLLRFQMFDSPNYLKCSGNTARVL